MANPALKNGYTAIANELIDKLALFLIPGSEMKIIWVVWRKTWGWNDGARKKDWDWISGSQFSALTGIERRNCLRAVRSLVAKRLILKEDNKYRFNQNYEEWGVSKMTQVVKNDTKSVKVDHKTVVKADTHKRKKTTNTKERAGHSPADTTIPELIKEFEPINPASKRFYGNTTQRGACEDLIREYGFERVKAVIQTTLPKTNAIPYFPTITTPVQLRDKWAALESAINKKRSEIKNKGKGIA